MQRLTPNTVLHDRFLLKEELSFESQKGQQTWAMQDQQTGQSLIARLHADGRVEWFNDNAPRYLRHLQRPGQSLWKRGRQLSPSFRHHQPVSGRLLF